LAVFARVWFGKRTAALLFLLAAALCLRGAREEWILRPSEVGLRYGIADFALAAACLVAGATCCWYQWRVGGTLRWTVRGDRRPSDGSEEG